MQTPHMKCALLLLLTLFLLPAAARCQIGNAVPQIKLANIDSSYASYAEVLAYPRLVTGVVGCEITEFTITFNVKDGQSYGPFTTRGYMLTEDQKILIKNLRYNIVKILITNISMRCDGQFVQPQNISLTIGY